MLLSVISVIKDPAPGFAKTYDSVVQEFGANGEVEYIIKKWSAESAKTEIQTPSERDTKLSIRPLKSPDSNVFDGMNQAARTAGGEWLLFLNAGDWFIPGFGKICLPFLKQHSSADYIYADGVTVDADDGREFLRRAPERLALSDFLHRAPYLHPCMIIRREVFLKHPFDLHYHLAADFKLMVQLLTSGKTGLHLNHPAACIVSGGLSEKYRIQAKRQALRALCQHSPRFAFKAQAITAFLRFCVRHIVITQIIHKIPTLQHLARKRSEGKPAGTYSN